MNFFKNPVLAVFAILLFLPLLVFAQDAGKKKAYLFYLDSCPHCHNVDKYFTENGIYDKYDIKKLDAKNPFNGNLLMNFYKAAGEQNGGGVPVVAFGDTMMVGDTPVIENFIAEIEKAEAGELPNPETGKIKIFDPTNGEATPKNGNKKEDTAENPSAKEQGENKSRSGWVILGAIIFLGVGGLLYFNRKEKI